MPRLFIVLSTTDTPEAARKLAIALVEEHLAACVSILPGVTSFYRWQGKMEESSECLLILKTSAERLEELQCRLAELHPYEAPEILALEVDSAGSAYLEWVVKETGGSGPP